MGEIVGQGRAIARLQGYLQGGRLPHALLFVGPDGVGRRTTADALARVLLCRRPRTEAPPSGGAGRLVECGSCEDCRMSRAGTHPDLHVVYKELARYHDDPKVRGRVMQELGIDVIRSFLISPAQSSPARGRAKVFVVLDADLMSDAAQNSLLKTLEEPPAGVTIVLICERPESLLATTVSRCATVRFGLLPLDYVRDRLVAEGMEGDRAAFWAGFTAGSLGRAIALDRRGMYEMKRRVLDRLAALPPAGDSALGTELNDLADKLAQAEVAEVKQEEGAELAKTLASRRAAGAMLELIAGAFRDAMALATGRGGPLAYGDQRPQVEAIAERFAPTQLARIIESLSRFEQILWRNVSPKLVWDNVVITCASARGPEM
jgi:DNA polymerase-3 subunit delta'